MSESSGEGKGAKMRNPVEGWEEVSRMNYEENDGVEGGNDGYQVWRVGVNSD